MTYAAGTICQSRETAFVACKFGEGINFDSRIFAIRQELHISKVSE